MVRTPKVLRVAESVAAELAGGGDQWGPFDPATLDSVPDPAARWLARAIPAGTELAAAAELSMRGEIKLGSRWMPFTARQVLRAGVGFVWQPVAGGRLVRFVGADILTPDEARMEFLLHGLVPVVKASGSDLSRSARGRLAAETIAWLPHAATPQAGARWRALDAVSAAVELVVLGEPVEVRVRVDDEARLSEIEMQRWRDSSTPPADEPFGGRVTSEHVAANGVRVAGSGTVGWGFGTPAASEGEFFRYRLSRWREAS